MSLIKAIFLTDPLGDRGKTFFQDQNGHGYRRIVGGLAWPFGDTPGFAVVVGEDFHKDGATGDRGYRILTEVSQPYVSDLVKWSFEAQKQYLVRSWASNRKNRGMLEFVSKFNRPYQPKGLRLFDAPHLDDPRALEFYIHLIRDKTKPDRKVLHFGDSQLANALISFDPENIRSASAEKYPEITSLGYAIAYLDSFDPDKRYDEDAFRDEWIKKKAVPGI